MQYKHSEMKKRKAPQHQSNNESGAKEEIPPNLESNPHKKRRGASHPRRIRIRAADHDRILALLETIEWEKAKNTSRKNVIRSEDPSTPRIQRHRGEPQAYCHSFIFGRNMKDPAAAVSWWSTQYPHIYSELQQLMQSYNPAFSYTHITLNKNLRCKRHTDGGNAGPSYIIGLGNYTGGALQIESNHGPDGSTIIQQEDLHSTFVLFNGKTQPHETLPFSGDRYTLVFYTSDMMPKDCTMKETSDPLLLVAPSTSSPQKMTIENVSASIAAKFNSIKSKLGRKRC